MTTQQPEPGGITPAVLNHVYATVDHLAELEGQDRSLVIEMSQAMINDLIETGALRPTVEYIRRYCDVLDSPDQAAEIAADI